MKHFYIIVNMDKPLAEKTGQEIEKFLSASGSGVTVSVWKGEQQRKYDIPKDTDCIITIGGDGTLIQTARAVTGLHIPLLGINRGHLGYLTQLSQEGELAPALKRLLNGAYMIEDRMMLRSEVCRNGKCIYKSVALNEVLLSRYDSLRTIHFRVYVNDICLNTYSADGLIIATPTGSTAYSLSAGGPIAEPGAKLMIMTPICSHTINSRSIILSPEDTIRIVPESDRQITACDGEDCLELLQGDEIIVRRSRHAAHLIRLSKESFMETLREKMTFV